ncbi:hypothetical protein HMI54_011129 [Coelomomyces lativittatus]|nr:hypothetical protein HMI54_011129 [Coelomomyces lativittatus]
MSEDTSSSGLLTTLPKSVIPKVIIRFTAIGDAPILKQSFFKISATQRFHSVMMFLRRELRLKKDGSLFLYINQAFAPNPDEKLGNLYDVRESFRVPFFVFLYF